MCNKFTQKTSIKQTLLTQNHLVR